MPRAFAVVRRARLFFRETAGRSGDLTQWGIERGISTRTRTHTARATRAFAVAVSTARVNPLASTHDILHLFFKTFVIKLL